MYIQKLNAKTGEQYRLPNETEWEYACLCDGLPASTEQVLEQAWCWENSENKTHPVGQKIPNGYGLYDMLGNVWGWTATDAGRNKVLHGGSWSSNAQLLRASDRGIGDPARRDNYFGFRLARTITKDDSNLEAARMKVKCLELVEHSTMAWWLVVRNAKDKKVFPNPLTFCGSAAEFTGG